MEIRRGDIVLADLDGAKYSEQGKQRLCLVIQNDTGNRYSSTTIVLPLTSGIKKASMPTHVVISKNDVNGLDSDSTVLCEQVRTLDKRRFIKLIGKVNMEIMKRVFEAYKANAGVF